LDGVRAALVACRGDLEPRRRVEVARSILLPLVASAPHEGIELDVSFREHGQRARRGNEDLRRARGLQRSRVTADEVHSVGGRQVVPRKRVGPDGAETLADDRDRALSVRVDIGEAAALRLGADCGMDDDTEPRELGGDPLPELVVADCREERAFASEARELNRRYGATPGRFCPDLVRVDDLAACRDVVDAHELDPLDVTDDGDPHGASLTSRRPRALQQMMNAVAIPPFETFYEEHRDEIYGYLRRLVGSQAADDAFQETFLRALRGYTRLAHAGHLRAWAYTIATRVAIDERRRQSPAESLPELPTEDDRPAYEELDHFTGDLPATERAAVVLRYGYDLPYAQIATALGSSEEAARQAASSGVRRLRRRMT
jgi:RNA polymerase sigma factor (sigma-70 family)